MAKQGLGYVVPGYEVDSPPYAHFLAQEGQFPDVMLQEPSAFAHNNTMAPPQPPPFPALGGDYRAGGLEMVDPSYSGSWCQMITPDYPGQMLGMSVAPQLSARSPLAAKPMEQQVNTVDFSSCIAVEQKMQPQLPGHLLPPTSAAQHGVYYPQWTPAYSMQNPVPTQIPAADCNLSPSSTVSTYSVPPTPHRRRRGQRNTQQPRKTKRNAANQGSAGARNHSTSGRRASHAASRNPEMENITQEELEAFAKLLKQKRVALGFTQADLGIALGNLYGRTFSQTTICRFEALQLSFANMCALLPLLKRWLAEVEASDNPQELHKVQRVVVNVSKRKNRTSLSEEARHTLENFYRTSTKPNTQQISQLSKTLKLGKDVVRVWFCNRRQKGKRMAKISAEDEMLQAALEYMECYSQMPQYMEHFQQELHMQGMPLPVQDYPAPAYPSVPSEYVPPAQTPEERKQVFPPGPHHLRN